MRTQDEILKKIKDLENDDFFGFKRLDLAGYLNYENIKPYLENGVTQEQWNPRSLDREKVLKEMLEYMPLAWDKANDFRGLSAVRSMQHYKIWVWLLGDEEQFNDFEYYNYYGKEHLIAICERYGWDWKQWDNGKRVNSESE